MQQFQPVTAPLGLHLSRPKTLLGHSSIKTCLRGQQNHLSWGSKAGQLTEIRERGITGILKKKKKSQHPRALTWGALVTVGSNMKPKNLRHFEFTHLVWFKNSQDVVCHFINKTRQIESYDVSHLRWGKLGFCSTLALYLITLPSNQANWNILINLSHSIVVFIPTCLYHPLSK